MGAPRIESAAAARGVRGTRSDPEGPVRAARVVTTAGCRSQRPRTAADPLPTQPGAVREGGGFVMSERTLQARPHRRGGAGLASRFGNGWSLADRLGEDLVRGLDPGKGAGSGVPVGGKQVDLGDELLDRTEASAPDRPAERIPNQVSTWFIQDADVGVKWKVVRGCRSSQARTSGVLWVLTLSRTTWSCLWGRPARRDAGRRGSRPLCGEPGLRSSPCRSRPRARRTGSLSRCA